MRGLQTHDIFIALKIANSAGVKEEVGKIYEAKASGKKIDEERLGFDLILSILGNCGNPATEKQIYEFLGGLLELDPKTLPTMPPLELFENVKKLEEVISIEEWKAFFQSLSRMLHQ